MCLTVARLLQAFSWSFVSWAMVLDGLVFVVTVGGMHILYFWVVGFIDCPVEMSTCWVVDV